MAKNNYFFPFFYKDWLMKTKFLTPEEKGIYIDLICYDFECGGLPNDDKMILKLCSYNGRNSAKMIQFIRTKFTLVEQDGKQVLRNKRVMEVSDKISKISDTRRKAAEIKHKKIDANAEQMQSKSNANGVLKKQRKQKEKVYIDENAYRNILIPLPFSNAIKKLLMEHFRNRVDIKKPVTERAANMLVKPIADWVGKFGEQSVLETIEKSIKSNYPDIYEPKIKHQPVSQPTVQHKPIRILGEE